MQIIKFILSIICIFFAIILGMFSGNISSISYKDNLSDKPKPNNISQYINNKPVEESNQTYELSNDTIILDNNNVKGGDESYSSLDNAQYQYSLYLMNKEIKGGKEVLKKTIKKNKPITSKEPYSWYEYKSWDDLYSNTKDWNKYLDDRLKSREEFLFNWEEVFKEAMSFVNNESREAMGVIRLRPDRRTLYIHKMELAPKMESTGSYKAGVPVEIVKKYQNIPAHFIFHTHPLGGDPLPSDADIYTCLWDCYEYKYVGHVVIGLYGAIVYFINNKRFYQLSSSNSAVKYFTYCYDLISAWNSICNSSGPLNEKDRASFLEHWGFDMIVIPRPHYISMTYDKKFTPGVLCDKFINTKYELLDNIKEFIKRLERRDEEKHNSN